MVKAAAAQLGENITVEMEGTVAIIKIDTQYRGTRSKSGKSIRVASTEGNRSLPQMPAIKFGINAYTEG